MSNPEANITGSRLGFLCGLAILAPLPTHRGAAEDDRRIFREGYNYNREFASRRDGIMLLAARPLPPTEPWREGGRGDGHGQMTKATPYQSRGQPRTPVRLVNECPQRRMEVGRDSGREGTSPIKWRDWHGRAAALPQTALGCVIDGGRWRRGRGQQTWGKQMTQEPRAASLPLTIESLHRRHSEVP